MQQPTSITHMTDRGPNRTEPEAAQRIGISLSGLRKKRSDGSGPPYLRIGRLIRYRDKDIEEWLEKRMISPENRVQAGQMIDEGQVPALPPERA